MNDQSFKQLAERTLNLLDLSVEVRCVQLDDGSTPAGVSLVRLEPSDRFGRVSAAIAARDIDGLVAEHVGLLRERMSDNEACPTRTSRCNRRHPVNSDWYLDGLPASPQGAKPSSSASPPAPAPATTAHIGVNCPIGKGEV